MSLQVGDSCYATQANAGAAACAGFVPVSQLTPDGRIVKTISCGSADPTTGALNLTVTSTPLDGSAPEAIVIQQTQAYPNCIQQDKVDAGLAIFGALLGFVAIIVPTWWLIRYLNHNQRADV